MKTNLKILAISIVLIMSSVMIPKTVSAQQTNVSFGEYLEKVTGRMVNPVAIQKNDNRGQYVINGKMQIFRHKINRTNNMELKPAPSKIVNLRDVMQYSEIIQISQPRKVNLSL